MKKRDNIYKKINNMKLGVGLKIVISVLILMLSFTVNSAQDFTSSYRLIDIGNLDITTGNGSTPTFADIDGDSNLDLYVGENSGKVNVFINDGSGNYAYMGFLQADGADIDVGNNSSPVFANLDNNCFPTLYVGNYYGIIALFSGIDVTNPTITCIDNQEVNADVTETYTVSGTEFDPMATDDNCGVESIINDFNNSATLAGAVLPVGTTTIIWTVTDEAENNADCSFEVLVNEYVGIEKLEEASISIYPNPTNGEITIDFSSYNGQENVKKVEITDITGKTVYTSTTLSTSNNQLKIDLSSFEKGIYIISIQTERERFTSKIVKK